MQLGKVRVAQQLVNGGIYASARTDGREAGSRAAWELSNEKDHRSDRWSPSLPALHCTSLPVSCGQTGGRRRVDARFALAVWTLAFGRFAVETSVPSDACHPWLSSLSALVTVGAGWCEKPPPSTERSNSPRKRRFPHEDDRATEFNDGPTLRAVSLWIAHSALDQQGSLFPADRHVN